MSFLTSIKNFFSGLFSGSDSGNSEPAVGKGKKEVQTFVFKSTPKTLEELKQLPEASLDTPFKTTALVMLALCSYKDNPEETYKMLDFLNGPETVNPYTKQFLSDRLKGKEYVVRSFFKGSSKTNDYTPTEPYTIDVMANPYSFDNATYATLWLQSSGADNPRSVALRQKPSTGEWFVRDIQCLGDIRTPDSQNPWA